MCAVYSCSTRRASSFSGCCEGRCAGRRSGCCVELNANSWSVRIGRWAELEPLALPLRVSVFVQEQGVPIELEQDELDEFATHAVVTDSTAQALATGRLVLTEPGSAKIGRLAVAKSHRGQGLGKVVLEALIAHGQGLGVKHLKLHAQRDAERFYLAFGFEAQGEPFMEAGIEHILMVRLD
jgi:predicted GNAT family N-acyltransferase